MFARKAFEEYMQSLGGYEPLKDFEEVDYDNIVPGQERIPEPTPRDTEDEGEVSGRGE